MALRDMGRRIVEAVEERVGHEIVPKEQGQILESLESDNRVLRKTLDFVGWSLFNYQGSQPSPYRMPNDMLPQARIFAAGQALRAWIDDPMAGQLVDLYISFVFGRGVPHPQAHDDEVQDRLDKTWNESANKEVLTSFERLIEKGVDLAIQSNVYWTLFDDGMDGAVRLSMLDFEDVLDVVRHPVDKYRILYYKVSERELAYDYGRDAYVTPPGDSGKPQLVYYEAFDAFDPDDPVKVAQDEQADLSKVTPPATRLRPGKVIHLAVNKNSRMAFGVPRMRRLLRWWCHDAATEALTADGWLGLDELKRRSATGTLPKVAAFDRETNATRYVDADLHVFPYEGEMVRFASNEGCDMLVTPNHRMLVRSKHWQDARYQFVQAQDIPRTANTFIKAPAGAAVADGAEVERFVLPGAARGRWSDRMEAIRESFHEIGAAQTKTRFGCSLHTVYRARDGAVTHEPTIDLPMDDFLRWVGWWAAEGYGDAEVCQAIDSPRLPDLKRACEALGLAGSERVTEGRLWRWRPYRARALRDWLAQHIGVVAREKRLPEFVFSLAAHSQQALMDGLMGGDGGPTHWKDQGRGTFATASTGLADDFQRLAYNAGWRATKRIVRIRDQIHYRVDVAARIERYIPSPRREWYCGEVWCFSTPLHTMVTRRNGACQPNGNTAYNEVLESHVNRMKAMASIYMKQTAKGDQRTLDRLAMMATGRTSAFGDSQEVVDPSLPPQHRRGPTGPFTPGIIQTNESMQMEPFKIDSGAADVAASIPNLRAQVSGAFPPTYYGQQSNSLAGDQSLELPVLKFIELDQELWNGPFRKLGERAIKRAVEMGDITEWRDPTEEEVQRIESWQKDGTPLDGLILDPDSGQVKRDLSFELSLPSPLKRAMGDLVTAAVMTATAVDPMGTNPELSRWLFGFILAEAFDVEDPQRIVDQVLPRHLAEQLAVAGGATRDGTQPGVPVDPRTATGPDGQQHPPNNPYGARVQAPNPEDRPVQEAASGRRRAELAVSGDRGRLVDEAFVPVGETAAEVLRRLNEVPALSGNGNGSGPH